MSTESTRVEFDFPTAVVTDGGRVEVYANGTELETIISKLYEANEVVVVHVVVEGTGHTRQVCGFVDPVDDAKYKWACKHFLSSTYGLCPREEDHAKKRQAALQPKLLEEA